MSTPRRTWTTYLLNGAIVLTGALALILLYALFAHVLNPRTAPAEVVQVLSPNKIQVEVRNGCGKPGVAGTVTRYLRDQGFDVVESGNHSAFNVPQTRVVDRSGDLDAARLVAGLLGIAAEAVQQELEPQLYLDTSVIIGLDYEGLSPFQPNP